MYLTLEAFAGEDIHDCCIEAVCVSNKMGIKVEFKFNEVLVMVAPGDDPAKLEISFHAALRSKTKFKIATGG